MHHFGFPHIKLSWHALKSLTSNQTHSNTTPIHWTSSSLSASASASTSTSSSTSSSTSIRQQQLYPLGGCEQTAQMPKAPTNSHQIFNIEKWDRNFAMLMLLLLWEERCCVWNGLVQRSADCVMLPDHLSVYRPSATKPCVLAAWYNIHNT